MRAIGRRGKQRAGRCFKPAWQVQLGLDKAQVASRGTVNKGTTMNLKAMMSDPAEFRRHEWIDTDAGPVVLDSVLDDWQRRDFEALDGGWQRVARRKVTAPGPIYLRSYLERPRGHSKTTDLAAMALYQLFSSQRKSAGVVVSGDRDEGRIVLDQLESIARCTPHLNSALRFQNWQVVNRHTGSTLQVISSDAATSWGLLVDYILVDELTHWFGANAQTLWESLISAAAKRRHCALHVISNAGLGMGSSWQWGVREWFRESPGCYFSRLDGPCASWMQGRLEGLRDAMSWPAYDRVVMNRWQSGSSDLLLDTEIQAAITLAGPSERERHMKYVAGVDLGISKNSAALVIVGKLGTRVKLIRAWEWKPPRGGKVSIDEIERTIIAAHKRYSLTSVSCDPWNAAQLVERCRKQHVPIHERPQSGKKLVEQAAALLEGFNTRSIDLFDCAPLLRDLRQARLEEKAFGVRIVSPTIDGRHGDVLTAFTIALAEARGVIARSDAPWGFCGTRPITPASTARGLGVGNGSNGMYGEAFDPNYRPGRRPTPKFF